MAKKISLLTDLHLCINPRLWKESFFYERMGYEVVVITKWQNAVNYQRDLEILKGHSIVYKCFLNIIPGEINPIKRFYYRLRKRIASEMQRYLKMGGAWAINHAPHLLFQKALEENADFYVAHTEFGFYAGVELLKAGKKVSFDFEDWYSRDYLTPDRAIGLLEKLENYALNHAVFCTAASDSMAKALQNVYQSKQKPITIYNSFPHEELGFALETTNGHSERFQIVWTSRTVGPNRGIETFLRAAALVKAPFDFHIIGECAPPYRQFLKNEFPFSKGHQLFIYDFIKHSQLLPLLSTLDIGLAIEQNTPDNKNTTVSNKILQYLQAGLQILATNTEGQKEIAEYFPNSVKTVKPNEPERWAEAIEAMMLNQNKFNKLEQQTIYEQYFSWQKQEGKLKKLINQYL